MAECDLVALHILSTSDGRCLGTPETLSMLFPMKCGLNSLKKNWIRLGISAAPGIEGFVSTSANHKDNERAATTGQGASRAATTGQGALQDQPQTLGRRSRCCPVLRYPKHSRRDDRSQQPKWESTNNQNGSSSSSHRPARGPASCR